jgi:hypothetical protein
MVFRLSLAAAAGCALMSTSAAFGAVAYGTAGSTYSQNFDSLPVTPRNANLEPDQMWADDTTPTASVISIPGWYLYHAQDPDDALNNSGVSAPSAEGGTNDHQRFRVNSPNSSAGSFYSFGNNLSSTPFDPDGADRALGLINSNVITKDTRVQPASAVEDYQASIGLMLTNTTGQTLTGFSLSYVGEQWRNGGANAAQKLDFQYSLTATAISDPNSAFVNADALDFTSPIASGAAAGLNGNLAANRTAISSTVSGITWLPGQTLWLRWVDVNDGFGVDPAFNGTSNSTADHGLGIDDLSFSAVPEPGSLALLGLGAGGMLVRRRRAAR